VVGNVESDADFAPNVTIVRLDRVPRPYFPLLYRLGFVARTYLAAWRIMRQHRIDVIHHIGPFGYDQTFNLLPLLGHTRAVPFVIGPLQVPHVVRFQDQANEESTGIGEVARQQRSLSGRAAEELGRVLLQVGRPVLRTLSRRTLRHCEQLVAVNEQARQLYSAIVPDVPIVVIPPGIALDRFGQVTAASRPGQAMEILYVGWLFRRKGVDLVITAVAQLVEQFPMLRLRIIGDGPQRAALQELVARHGITDHVVFEGAIGNALLADYYARADIFVSMSYSESFGQTLVESMACGLPVVSAENMGSCEIITDGETGFLVEAGNVQVLTARLRDLLCSPHLRREMGERARRVVRQRHDWKTIGEQYLEVYRTAVRCRSCCTGRALR
jgi:glycosyltransferase involved in cell wall biosynthesis